MKLLNITASPRGEKSRTLIVSMDFLNTLKAKYPNLVIENLDLYHCNLPDVLGKAMDAKYAIISGGVPDEDSQTSWNEISTYSKEFLKADIYLISTPMWNFSIPYKLKHYIDIIMQPGILFKYTANGVEGLAKNKKMFCITTRGNDYTAGGAMFPFDFQEPYLRAIFGLAGITDISFINAQPLDFTSEITNAKIEKAREEAKLMASNFELMIA